MKKYILLIVKSPVFWVLLIQLIIIMYAVITEVNNIVLKIFFTILCIAFLTIYILSDIYINGIRKKKAQSNNIF